MTKIKASKIINTIKSEYRNKLSLVDVSSKVIQHFIHDEYEHFLSDLIEDEKIVEEFTSQEKSDEEWLDLIESTPNGVNHILYDLILLRFHLGV